MEILAKLIVNGLAVLITSYLLSGVRVVNFLTAVVVALVLGIINAIIKPILVILTLPINILTLGIFTFIINGIMILIVSAVVPGFTVRNLGWAILFSLTLSIVNFFLNSLTR